MKKLAILGLMCLFSVAGLAQSFYGEGRKTPTQEQRLTKAQDKKTKRGKKQLSMEKKVKMSKKQDRKARREKPPKGNKH